MLYHISNHNARDDTHRLCDPGHNQIAACTEYLINVKHFGIIQLHQLINNRYQSQNAKGSYQITQNLLFHGHGSSFDTAVHNGLFEQAFIEENIIFFHFVSSSFLVFRMKRRTFLAVLCSSPRVIPSGLPKVFSSVPSERYFLFRWPMSPGISTST